MDTKSAIPLEAGDGVAPVKEFASHDDDMVESVKSLVDADIGKLRDSTMSPSNHVPPFTGNEPYNFSPTLESYLFTQTPAGSELCSWAVDPMSSTNELASPLIRENATCNRSKRPSHGKLKKKRREDVDLRRENALRALALEHELSTAQGSNPQSSVLIIRFPDAEITSSLVAGFSNAIRDVVLPVSVAPRYCLVHLKTEVDVECTIAEINQVRFGNSYLRAELKNFTDEEQADYIDPCSLYVSNLPFSMTTAEIKAKFPQAQRVDMGVISRNNKARYAFVRYANADEAMESYRKLQKTMWLNRELIVRFRRLRKLPFSQKLLSNSTSNTTGNDDDLNECRVISPPPLKPIVISDSEETGSETDSITTLQKKRKCAKKQEKDDEVLKLKARMAKFEEIIKNLQGLQDNKAFPLLEKESQIEQPMKCSEPRPLSPNTLRAAIKIEHEYLGISEDASANMSPYRPTTVSNGFGQHKSSKSSGMATDQSELMNKRTAAKDTDRLEQLYAQLDSDSDA